ncbi:MAG: hypothetical protein DMG06_20625 [Acidobacteria bacterium]|nr:MAG: hypothetical protein DMG06_20625 [Acidobacteriota bacterium]
MPSKLFLWLLWLMVGIGASWIVPSSLGSLQFQGDNTHSESTVVVTGLWAAKTGHLYPAIHQPPFTPAPYGPLLYMGLAAIAKVGASSFEQLLVAGRFAVFTCYLALIGLVFLWARRVGFSYPLAVLCAGFVLLIRDFTWWNASVRPDVPALLLSFLGFSLASRRESPTQRDLLLSGSLMGIALLIKQSSITAPLAALLWLASRRLYRGVGTLIAGVILPILLVCVFLWVRKEPYLEHMTVMCSAFLDPFGAVKLLLIDLLERPFHLMLLTLALSGGLIAFLSDGARAQLLALYFLLAWVTAFLTLFQSGGSNNYLLEPWLVSALLTPFAVQNIQSKWKSSSDALRLAFILFLGFQLLHGLRAWRWSWAKPISETHKELARMLEGQRLLSDIPYVAVHGRNPELLDGYLMHILELRGRWSPAPILRNLRNKVYDAVVVSFVEDHLANYRGYTFYSHSILGEIVRNYSASWTCQGGVVFLPKGKNSSLQNETTRTFAGTTCKSADPAAVVQLLAGSGVNISQQMHD